MLVISIPTRLSVALCLDASFTCWVRSADLYPIITPLMVEVRAVQETLQAQAVTGNLRRCCSLKQAEAAMLTTWPSTIWDGCKSTMQPDHATE
jgi:hypothetical protein